VQIREFPSGKLVGELNDPALAARKVPANYARIRFSPDGSRLVTVRRVDKDAEVVVWDIAQPDAPHVLATHASGAATGVELARMATDLGPFGALRFTPNSKRVSFASADRKSYRVFDVTADPPAVVTELAISDTIRSAEWHPTAPVLAVREPTQSGRDRIALWDVEKKAVRAVCGGGRAASPDAGVSPFAFSPNGRWLAVGGRETSVSVYGALDGVELVRVEGAVTLGIFRIFWTPDNELVTVGLMEGLKIWRLEPAAGAETYRGLRPAGRPAFSPDGHWLAVLGSSSPPATATEPAGPTGLKTRGARDRLTLIDRRTGELVRSLPGVTGLAGRVFFAPDGSKL